MTALVQLAWECTVICLSSLRYPSFKKVRNGHNKDLYVLVLTAVNKNVRRILHLSELLFFLIAEHVQMWCLEIEDTCLSWWGGLVSSVLCLLLSSCSGLRDSGCVVITCPYLQPVVMIAEDFSLLWLIRCPLICIRSKGLVGLTNSGSYRFFFF